MVKVLEVVAGDLADAALESIERDARGGIVRGRLEGGAEAVLAATAAPRFSIISEGGKFRKSQDEIQKIAKQAVNFFQDMAVKEGRGSHADSLGNVAIVRSGGIQWMRTASGIEHAEGGGNPKNANKHGFQLWINLPSHLKMSKPAYGTIQPEKIPEMVSPDSVRTRYIAGWNSAAFLDRVGDFTIIDVEMPLNTKHKLHIPPHLLDTILVYSYRGSAGTVNLKKLKPHSIARLIVDSSNKNNKDDVHNKEEEEGIGNGANCTNYNMDQSAIIELKSYNSDFGVIVFAGKRINEKIAWRGPIVMNTWGEINLAYKELRNGKGTSQL